MVRKVCVLLLEQYNRKVVEAWKSERGKELGKLASVQPSVGLGSYLG